MLFFPSAEIYIIDIHLQGAAQKRQNYEQQKMNKIDVFIQEYDNLQRKKASSYFQKLSKRSYMNFNNSNRKGVGLSIGHLNNLQ